MKNIECSASVLKHSVNVSDFIVSRFVVLTVIQSAALCCHWNFHLQRTKLQHYLNVHFSVEPCLTFPLTLRLLFNPRLVLSVSANTFSLYLPLSKRSSYASRIRHGRGYEERARLFTRSFARSPSKRKVCLLFPMEKQDILPNLYFAKHTTNV